MQREEIIQQISRKMKLIRTERGINQEKMADMLGISKKTLVQIEKERSDASWTVVVAVCALFRESGILITLLGDDPLEVIQALANGKGIYHHKEKTLGGKIWWKSIQSERGYRLQQNLISKHYRILDEDDYRWYSSFSKEDADNFFKKITVHN